LAPPLSLSLSLSLSLVNPIQSSTSYASGASQSKECLSLPFPSLPFSFPFPFPFLSFPFLTFPPFLPSFCEAEIRYLQIPFALSPIPYYFPPPHTGSPDTKGHQITKSLRITNRITSFPLTRPPPGPGQNPFSPFPIPSWSPPLSFPSLPFSYFSPLLHKDTSTSPPPPSVPCFRSNSRIFTLSHNVCLSINHVRVGHPDTSCSCCIARVKISTPTAAATTTLLPSSARCLPAFLSPSLWRPGPAPGR
jgi:hypothetical protein